MSIRNPRSSGGDNFLEGKLLIAMPGMTDPHFEKSVIFMCAHSAEGAMGIMINKPVAGLSFHDLVQKLELAVTPSTPNIPVLYGGPVETGRGFVLHTGDYESSEATLPVSEDVSLTATLDILRAMADGRGPQHAIFALGYAGWRAGQIEDEIRRNGWIHCDSDPSLLFDPEPDAKWASALRKLGIDVSGLSAHTGHA
ncbi:MAG TPA: YqgE/AlgH family protein [Rhizomicrobium sp.]|jgi:putative transcriptional regulator|nr:YqgE/AlgH family protein [Rhizomicrobium sp.]